MASAAYLAIVLWALPFVSQEAGGQVPFDLRPTGYSMEDAQAFLSALSAPGRDFYLGVQHKLDIFFPAVLALTFILGFQMLFSRWWATFFGFVALLGAASDYLENYLVSVMLTMPVETIEGSLVSLSSFWTISKSISSTLCFAALLFGAARVSLRRWVL